MSESTLGGKNQWSGPAKKNAAPDKEGATSEARVTSPRGPRSTPPPEKGKRDRGSLETQKW